MTHTTLVTVLFIFFKFIYSLLLGSLNLLKNYNNTVNTNILYFIIIFIISEVHPLLSNKTKDKQLTGGKKGPKRGPKQQ